MRKLAIFALSFTAAVAAMIWLPSPLCLVAPTAALLAFAASFFLKKRRVVRILALGLAFGFFYMAGYSALIVRPAEALCGENVSCEVCVESFPEADSGRVRVDARMEGHSALLTLYGDSWENLRPGDVLQGEFRICAPEDDSYGRYLRASGYALNLYAAGELRVLESADLSLRHAPACCANALGETLDKIFPEDVAPFLRAFLLGDRTKISDETTAALRDSGVVHIISVSGAHVSMLSALVLWLCLRRRRVAAVVSVAVCLFFTALVGFPPSAVRATLMITVTLLAPIFGREQDLPTTVCFALFVQLLCNPYALASLSLQLSYAAVAGIAAYAQPIYRRMTARVPNHPKTRASRLLFRGFRAAAAALSLTLSANVFTGAICALNFRSFSLISPLTNLLTMPLFSLAFPFGVLTLLCGLVFPTLARFFGQGVAIFIRLALAIAEKLSQLSFAALPLSEPAFALWLLLAYVLLLAFFVFKKRVRLVRLFSCIALMLCICLAGVRIGQKDILFTAFDVGQGQCVLFEADDVRVMVDCGGDTDGRTLARSLRLRGKGRIDALILTHFDTDHANAVCDFLSLADVRRIYVPELQSETALCDEIFACAQARGVQIVTVTQDLTLDFGTGRVQIFAPMGKATRNNGLAALLTQGEFDILVTGDLPQTQERLLLKSHKLPDIELLVVGHHGAENSTCAELLRALRPEIAVISVGENAYGHPTQAVLDRLQAADVQILRTDELGEIRIRR